MGIDIKYQPKQLEMRKAVFQYPVVFVGGARGGGKSHFARNIAIEFAHTYPGINIAIFRKHYPELEANHIDPILQQFPELRKHFKVNRKLLQIPVGGKMSLIRFCHCGSMQDLKKYQGSEFQIMIVDEAGEWTGELLTRLRASNRTSNKTFPVKLILTGNPGGDGHDYLKRLFVQRNFIPPERAEDYFFVPAFLEDNQALLYADPEYKSRLEQEPNEAIRRAWLYGDWNVFSGQYFQEFRREIHIIENLDIEKDLKGWRKFGAMDWGHYHPCAFLWLAQNPENGDVVVYREYLTREESPESIRDKVLSYPDSHELKWTVTGADTFNRMKDGGPSIEEKFRTGPKKLFLIKANLDRLQGWAQVRAYLRYDITKEGVQTGPKLRIARTCHHLIDGIPRLQHDLNKPEDVRAIQFKENMQIGDGEDQVDALRYGLMSLTPLTKEVAAKQRNRGRLLERYRKGRASSWITS